MFSITLRKLGKKLASMRNRIHAINHIYIYILSIYSSSLCNPYVMTTEIHETNMCVLILELTIETQFLKNIDLKKWIYYIM